MTTRLYFFDGGNVTNAFATQGTVVNAQTQRQISAANVTNTTGATINFTLTLVPYLGTSGTTNTYISARPIEAGESYSCSEILGLGLNAQGFLQAKGSANGLTFKYSAVEYS